MFGLMGLLWVLCFAARDTSLFQNSVESTLFTISCEWSKKNGSHQAGLTYTESVQTRRSISCPLIDLVPCFGSFGFI